MFFAGQTLANLSKIFQNRETFSPQKFLPLKEFINIHFHEVVTVFQCVKIQLYMKTYTTWWNV